MSAEKRKWEIKTSLLGKEAPRTGGFGIGFWGFFFICTLVNICILHLYHA